MADDEARETGGASPTEDSVSSDTDRKNSSRSGRRTRSSNRNRDLTKGSIRKHLWYLGWPQVAEGALSVVDQLADLIWAGRIGFQAIAGLGAAQAYLSTIMMARMGLDSSMRSMIARAVGAREVSYANHVLLQALTLTSVLAIIIIALIMWLTDFLLAIMGLSDAVINQASGYMRVQIVAMMVLSFQRITGGALQASGDSMTPLRAATATRVSHLILSPFLIFGWIGFPEMGLVGAGVARLAAEFIGVAMNFHALSSGKTMLRLNLREYRLDIPLMWSILKLGAPASVTNMQRGISQLVVVGIAAQFGDIAIAVFALTRRTENIVNQATRGLGRAAGALAGQNLGAGLVSRAKSSLGWALVFAIGFEIPVIMGLMLFPEAVAQFINGEPDFIATGAKWIFIAAIGYMSMGLVQVLTQGFNTSGAMVAPMIITVSTMWLFEIPLAFILANYTSLGQFGVPWAIVAGMTVRLLFFVVYYFSGKWLRTGLL